MTDSTSTDLDRPVPMNVATMTDADIDRMYRIAKALALSKRFPDARTAEEAFAKVLLGRDLGMNPTQAMTGIHIVEGKPQIAAVTLAGFVRKSERYEYVVKEMTDLVCTIEFWGTWLDEPLGVSTFTKEMAKRAGLKVDNPNSNWAKYPENMLFARAMSNGVKWYCPDLMGGIPVYTEADVFEGTATPLDEGRGNGDGPGWGNMDEALIADVQEVIDRAEKVGHAGLANVATAQMRLVGQPDDDVREWIAWATGELDAMAPTEAEVEAAVDIDRDALETKRGELVDLIAEGEQEDAPAATLAALREQLADVEGKLAADSAWLARDTPGQEGLPL